MKKKTTEPRKYEVKNETVTALKNIMLDGTYMLKAEKVTATYQCKREIHPKSNLPYKLISKDEVDIIVKPLEFKLVEVTEAWIAQRRKTTIPTFILKTEGRFYATEIPKDMSFVASGLLGGRHKCAVAGNECGRLSAAKDEKGGCAKVRNKSIGIEKYPWITQGYETINTITNSFFVAECEHYEKCPPRTYLPVAELNKLKLGIAQYVWEDVETIEEVKSRRRARHLL